MPYDQQYRIILFVSTFYLTLFLPNLYTRSTHNSDQRWINLCISFHLSSLQRKLLRDQSFSPLLVMFSHWGLVSTGDTLRSPATYRMSPIVEQLGSSLSSSMQRHFKVLLEYVHLQNHSQLCLHSWPLKSEEETFSFALRILNFIFPDLFQFLCFHFFFTSVRICSN